ncbi:MULTISPECIES: RNA chaperone Hfq [Bacillus]|uniref:RNA chaperone Hfq n=1 Tax=Bacillus TaxID=1386 RepID=UPI000992087C|nr:MULTISPECIES: RNA chaperone Hfq [Bacillus cereus group]MCQ6306764.1 RNA chaperone Hfq [Bacillus cereus]OOR61435.1 RNA chaperone Hfq [Bacillus mycoides]PHG57840.1 RNA chaperone Hfq [Bacillus toyonensis]HEQ3527520.1 RNA chaperone Hfq [Bacillus cereus]
MINIQDELYQQVIESKKEVTIILLNGFRIPGQIIAVDKFTILIKNNDKQQLIYKQAISTVAV